MDKWLRRGIIVVALILLLVFILACTPVTDVAGSSERQGVYFPTLGSNVLEGTSATHADGNTTPIHVAFGTIYDVYVACSGDVDVDTLSYWISADRTNWVAGSQSLSGCRSAGPVKYSINDTGIHWIQFDFDINATNATGSLTTILSVK